MMRQCSFEHLEARRLLHAGHGHDQGDYVTVEQEDGSIHVQVQVDGAHLHGDQIFDDAVRDVVIIDQRANGPSTLELAATRVARISRDPSLPIYQDLEDQLKLTGNWQLMGAERQADDFYHRLSDGEITLLLENGRPWQNPLYPFDVDADLAIVAQDVQMIVSEINNRGSGALDSDPELSESARFVDTSGDQHLTARDVLLVVSEITTNGSGPIPGSGHDHNHDSFFEVPEGETAPTVAIEVTQDPKSGWNLHVDLQHFEIAPEQASTDNIFGKGHLHLYIDGVKTTRLYATDYFLGDLPEGEHSIMVEVSANDHSAYAVEGVPIQATTVITVPPSEDGSHQHPDPVELAADQPVPTVSLSVTADPASGWNLRATVANFRLAPENVSTDHVDGEGHLHLYIDGVKITRLYDEWYFLGSLSPGTHKIRVELSSNTHGAYTLGGEIIDDEVMIVVPDLGQDSPETDPGNSQGGHSHG